MTNLMMDPAPDNINYPNKNRFYFHNLHIDSPPLDGFTKLKHAAGIKTTNTVYHYKLFCVMGIYEQILLQTGCNL
jgi:hypothetical protein